MALRAGHFEAKMKKKKKAPQAVDLFVVIRYGSYKQF